MSSRSTVRRASVSLVVRLEEHHTQPGKAIFLFGREHPRVVAEGLKLYGEEKFGRDDPCPCGSGKKYKNCCGG